jgi:hypothetical protein
MSLISNLFAFTARSNRLARFGALTLAAVCAASAPTARADLIQTYSIDMMAQVSGYNNGAHGSYITVTGQFLFDSTLGYITSTNLNVTGNLNNGYNIPVGGVAINTARTGNETASDLSAQSADGNYSIRFQFANPLTFAGTFDSVLNSAATSNGDAQFYDAFAGSSQDTTYHIGYFGVTGGAVPEPTSIALLGGSLASLAFFRRRAFRKSASA